MLRQTVSLLTLAGCLTSGASFAQSIVPIAAPENIQERIPTYRLDTRALRQPIDVRPDAQVRQTPRLVHQPDFAGPLNNLVPGGVIPEPRISPDPTFGGMTATGWYPPDPDLAVGPNHILQVVNASIAWYTKSGTLQFQQTAGTFFSGVAQTTFIFDPKCFYDRVMYSVRQGHPMLLYCFPVTINFYL